MSGSISSGIGLVSGLPTQAIIDQLIAIQARPLLLLQGRIQGIQAQRTAFADLAARLLGLKSTIARLDEPSFFRASKATSSNNGVITAVAGENAARGTFQFQVRSLVTNHQLIGRGFANADSQPVGVGTMSLEIGHGRLDPPTSLKLLNGGEGVRRGKIEITDSSGDKAIVDLSTALSVRDVLDGINSRTDIQVNARIEAGHLVIEDLAGGDQASLTISEVGGGHTATDLGIAQQDDDEDGSIVGDNILYLSDTMRFDVLNDRNGVSVGKGNRDIDITIGSRTFTIGLRGLLTPDTQREVLNNGNGVREGTFRITNRAGETVDIVIDQSFQSIADVLTRINDGGIDVTASLGAVRGQLILTDTSTPADGQELGNLKIEDITGKAAADLGILADTEDSSVTGNEIHRVTTIGDVLRAINFSVDGDGDLNDVIEARVGPSGRGIELLRLSGTEEFTVGVGANSIESSAAEQLGLVGESVDGQFVTRDVLAGLDSVLLSTLRGGSGISLGVVKLQAADGQSQAEIDLTGVATVQELIDRINSKVDQSKIRARINDVGNGIIFEDESGGTVANTKLKDLTGGTIRDLFGLEGAIGAIVQSNQGFLDSRNTQLQYVSLATSLTELNGGRGVSEGSFQIVASNGQSATVNINENQKTVAEVIARINTVGIEGISARLNANGDGIEILDTTGGAGELTIQDVEGDTTAADLNIVGTGVAFDDGDSEAGLRIDGSFEYTIEIDADDTLEDVREKINALGIGVGATIINDGGTDSAYHLIISSEVSGTRGSLVLDTGGTDLSFDTLVQAQDAVVFFGGAGAENPIILTSSTNVLTDALDDVTINLVGTSDEPVELSISQDADRIVADLNTFVSSYNAVLDRIDNVTRFNSETFARGILFGDSTVNLIQNRLRVVVTADNPSAKANLDRLTLIGISVGAGGRLSFDDTKFREVMADDREAVERLFTTEEDGIGHRLDKVLDDLTRGFDGVLATKDDALEKREKLFEDRIESLLVLLDQKRARLERQFQGLESSLASLQGAQAALNSIVGLLGTAF